VKIITKGTGWCNDMNEKAKRKLAKLKKNMEDPKFLVLEETKVRRRNQNREDDRPRVA